MSPPAISTDKSFHPPATQLTGRTVTLLSLTPGEEDAPNRLFATQRENENAHANTATFKGFDLSIRATPKIAMTERSLTPNGYLKPGTQVPKHYPPAN